MTKESKLHVESLSVPRAKLFEHDEVTKPKHYQLRERNKNGLVDLKKARQHLDWLIELEVKDDN